MLSQLRETGLGHKNRERFSRRDIFWAGLGFFLTAGFHLLYFFMDSEHIAPDTQSYLCPAISILQGKGFIGCDELPETMRTPGYPLFLAACTLLGMGTSEVVILQHLFLAALTLGIYYLARTLGASKGLGLLACVLYSIDFPSLQGANRVLTEALFTVILFLVGWIAIRWTKEPYDVRPATTALAGLLAGLSALIRPISVFYVFPLGATLWLSAKKKRILNPIVLTICFLALPLGWAFRNQREAGVFALSSITGETLLFWRAAGALAISEKGDFDTLRAFHAERLRKIALERLASAVADAPKGLSHAKKAEAYSELAKEILLDHPWETFLLTVRGVGSTLIGGGEMPISKLTGLHLAYARFISVVWGSLCLLCFLRGAHALWKQNWRAAFFLLMTVGYFVFISAGGEAYSRFRVPVVPFYVVGTAYGIGQILSHLRRSLS